ncbi:glycoside hydrolase family 13 protein [Phycicoccus sp. MAQZ13P-2]|uniref:glycoside hydrolase family 13 protein n=1 Tax=Phycicoccus mangrovi TaxID=2840470 RepID=UPI001C0010CD|nr:alpha-amylase family glycosyl hydrolase [Phycicoccus mangrovi]MBT9255771.1 glycoside hydrolase family 13 protein [Phycicoccus mangrovi]MBT9274365.1 glycoside hydrolase family 13 protein [Phycicoccus mangrovi]
MGTVSAQTSRSPLTAPGTTVHPADAPGAPWWHDAVIYQVYPRSWADADGDGIGDLPGITARLPHLRDLGVDAVWLSPFYVSPMNDAGYDVADYRDIDPLFGSLEDADRLLATAHDLGLKVLVDLVPNHTSSEHAWFRAALAAAPGSPERDRYVFRDGRGPNGDEPPNNWPSVFGGKGWTRVTEADGTPGQWYLHIFDVTQPDLNWQNPEVREELESILRFWCDRGVDGFRVDVAHGLVKEEGLPDWHGAVGLYDEVLTEDGPQDGVDADADADADSTVLDHTGTGRAPMWDQDGVHEIYRSWRTVLDSYGEPDRILCAEAWVKPEERLALYVRPDEMHQAFNFDFLETPWHAGELAAVIESSLRSNDAVGAPTTWVLSNHDVVRHASRLGLPQDGPRPNGIAADDPQPDAELGLRRARAATALMLGLPGGAYLYQGEELGLPEHTTMPHDVRQDPTFHHTKGEVVGRDGCRVPMPWTADGPSLGFGPGDHPWLPQPEAYAALAVDRQEGVEGSTLELYRTLLRLRRELGLGGNALTWDALTDGDVVAYRSGEGADAVLVVTNTGQAPVGLPDGEVLVASGPLEHPGTLPGDTTVWLRPAAR